jgi:hypothetical protein
MCSSSATGSDPHPDPDCFLDGITRRSGDRHRQSQGLRGDRAAHLPEELARFSECFIVGTAAEVTPVAQIGEHTLPARQHLALADGRLRPADPEGADLERVVGFQPVRRGRAADIGEDHADDMGDAGRHQRENVDHHRHLPIIGQR